MKLSPHYMLLNYTTECNSRCTTCATWAGPQFTLPVDVFKRIGRFVSPMNLKEVYFTGGEALLPDNCVEMAVAVTEWCPWVILAGATNSLEPDLYYDRVKAMQEHGCTLRIFVSLNGPPELHDRTRGVPGAHQKALEMADGLRQLGALLAFNQLILPDVTTEADIAYVKQLCSVYGCRYADSPVMRRMEWFGQSDDGQKVPIFDGCHGGTGVICIRPNGDITACQEPRSYLVFGNLRDEALDERLALDIQATVAEKRCQPCGCCTEAISKGIRCST
jgi:MoaA/NifB/PqqE/SkfB family radical SAM enzyme